MRAYRWSMENMVKCTYQLPTHTLKEFLNSNICLLARLEFIGNGFSYTMAHELNHKGIQCMDYIWVSENQNLLLWVEAHVKFNLAQTKVSDWMTLTTKILAQQHHLLDEDPYQAPGQWIGPYRDREPNLTFVMGRSTAYTPSIMNHYCFFMSLAVKCFTVDTYYGRTQVKTIHTTREQKQKEASFFYGKTSTLSGDLNRWSWVEGWHFLNYNTKFNKGFVINWTSRTTWAVDKWQGYLLGKYKFHWAQFLDSLQSHKEAIIVWSIWQKTIAIREWRTHIAPTIISKLCIFLLFLPSQHEWIVQTKVMGLHSN